MTRRHSPLLTICFALFSAGCGGTGGNFSGGPPPGPPVFLYVTNGAAGHITGFVMQPDGTLRPMAGSPFLNSGAMPMGIMATNSAVYVANHGSASISAFTYDGHTGALTSLPGSPFAAPAGVRRLAVCSVLPSGTYLYAVADSGKVAGYSIASDNSLLPVPGSPVNAGTNPQDIAVDAFCLSVIVANTGSNNLSVYSINTSDGSLTAFAGSPFATGTAPTGVALDVFGSFVYVANSGSNDVSAFRINGLNGSLVPITGSPFAAGQSPVALATSPLFGLYVANSGSNNLTGFGFSFTSGALTPVAGSPFAAGTQPRYVISGSAPPPNFPRQVLLYAANGQSNDISAFTIGAGGALLAVAGSPFPAGADPQAMAVAVGH